MFQGQDFDTSSGQYDKTKEVFVLTKANVTLSTRVEVTNNSLKLEKRYHQGYKEVEDAMLRPTMISRPKNVTFLMLKALKDFNNSCEQVISFNGDYQFEVKSKDGFTLKAQLRMDVNRKY